MHDFAILAAGDLDEMKTPWGLDKVFNFYINQSNFWAGDPPAWKTILDLFEFREFDPINYPTPDVRMTQLLSDRSKICTHCEILSIFLVFYI